MPEDSKLEQGLQLPLQRCPHCSIAQPHIPRVHYFETTNHAGAIPRAWSVYVCKSCGGAVTAFSIIHGYGTGTKSLSPVIGLFPDSGLVDDAIPKRARTYLQQAKESLHAPPGAIMLANSAVDAMLKVRGLKEGSLYSRIDQAAKDHLITEDMATWAHDIRLDANDQRHADEDAELPEETDAQRVIDFASALGEILFVLPARVQRGLKPPAGEEDG